MSDINFLAGKKNNHKKKVDKKDKQEVEWTKPAREEKIISTEYSGKRDKIKPTGWFSLFKKEKRKAAELPKEPVLTSLGGKNKKSRPIGIDKERLKHSRKELLRLVKEHESKLDASEREQKKKDKNKDKSKSSSWLSRLFKRKDSRKKVSVDYKSFNKHKINKEEAPVKQVDTLRKERKFEPPHIKILPKKEKAPVDSTVKVKKEGMFDKLADFWRSLFKKKPKTSIIVKKEPSTHHNISDKEMHEIYKINKKDIPDQKINIEKKEIKLEHREKDKKEERKALDTKEKKQKWESSNILETNLIKGELSLFFSWRKNISILLLYIIFSSLIVTGVYGSLLLWGMQQKDRGKEFTGKIEDLNKQIKPLEEDVKEILIVYKKIKQASYLLSKHIYWTNFFKFLEDNTVKDVYYFPFSGDKKGVYTLSAKAKDFKTILDQVNILRLNDNVIQANVSGGSVSGASKEDEVGGVGFQLKISIDPNIFTK